MSESPQRYLRFLLSDRVLHLLLLISFTVLGLTGLVQKYADASISVFLIQAMGGIEQTRVFHHTFAVILILTSIAHAVQLGYRVYVQRKPMTMLPTLADVTDFIGAIKYNAGLSKQKPRFPRYNFMEKLEYWAVVWGTVLMTLTGYVLWNPVLITQYLPGEVVPAAKIAHGMEAVLAVLAIVSWHFYFVHFKTFNKSIFTGTISHKEMEEEHPLELEQQSKGRVWKPPTPELRYRRLRLYAPLAMVFVLVSVLATWRWLTAEATAITTVPRAAVEERVYQPVGLQPRTALVTPTAAPTPLSVLSIAGSDDQAGAAPLIPHAIAGEQAECLLCHATGSTIRPAPDSHAAFAQEQCVTCHAAGEPESTSEPAAATPVATSAAEGSSSTPSGMPAVPHDIGGAMAQCALCHQVGSGANPMPASHAAFSPEMCLTCHQSQPSPAGPPAATPSGAAEGTPTPTAPPAAGMPAIPDTIAGDWARCSACHSVGGGMRPLPASHAAFPETQCLSCHQPAGGSQ